MCGLVGTARLDRRDLDESADGLVRQMIHAVAHRGPDDAVLRRFGPVALGFTRLALVDPMGGRQPLTDEDDALALIVNGEIYNHEQLRAQLPANTRLRTSSDCEVLLHLYRRDGPRYLDRVRGMFARVLCDRRRNRLICARDRFGIKPLFYHRNATRIVFASEIKALFEDPDTPRELNWERALADQLVTAAPVFEVAPAHSWFRDIELVPAATIVAVDVDTGHTEHHRYWQLPSVGGGDGAEAELVRDYGETLAASVAESEMADVDIGLFLSGGIDSAAVAALTRTTPQTFSALNASTLVHGDAESAHRIAAQLGLVNHQVLADAAYV